MRFSLLRFPITIDPSFLLMVILLGGVRADVPRALLWISVVFVSILIHELGHALMARGFGYESSILLYSMGGMTIWQPNRAVPERQRIFISAAGPLAGFMLGALVWAVSQSVPPNAEPWVHIAVWDLLWVNVGWGMLNLLPILPLDGGHIMLSLIQAVRGPRGARLAYVLSMAVSLAVCLAALRVHMLWGAMLAAWMAYQNFRMTKMR